MDENIKKEFILKFKSNSSEFSDSNDSIPTIEAVGQIQEVVGEKGYVGGQLQFLGYANYNIKGSHLLFYYCLYNNLYYIVYVYGILHRAYIVFIAIG